MATKLVKQTYPAGHGENDFSCFGPPASQDAKFEGTLICDMGCFKQDMVDSNKYYHGAVVQSTKDNSWHAYFEWGRQGVGKPQFQFVSCNSKAEAESEYCKQLHSKNDKRGMWINDSVRGNVLRAKPGDDCYLVRPQATRITGLPNARTIVCSEGVSKKAEIKNLTAKSKSNIDKQTLALMHDLNVGTVSYTRSAMQDAAIPTQLALNEARLILNAALVRVASVGHDLKNQNADNELRQLSYDLYGRISKKKDRKADVSEWILNQDNIQSWQLDVDAFESALHTTDLGSEMEENPFGDMPIKMNWLAPNSTEGEFIGGWMPSATRSKHGYLNKLKIKNTWQVERLGEPQKLMLSQQKIAADKWVTKEKPFHQPSVRNDLDRDSQKLYVRSNTYMFFHGTRSVNVSGILRESLRLPKQLVGVVINGAMFGPGLYWADDWGKSAGYTSLSSGYYSSGSGGIKGRSAFMFVADVAIGCPHVAPSSNGFTQPPSGCHSVFGKGGSTKSWGGGGTLLNNEFITYTADRHRLRYLVEFEA